MTRARHDVRGKRISIIGAAKSGIAAALLLDAKGAVVFVSDNQPAERLVAQKAELAARGIPLESGQHSARVFDADFIVVSPGVPSTSPVILEAVERHISIVSELEAASWFCNAPVVAVTGSNGKTTTTSLIGRMLHDAKKKHVVAGNIGAAFSSVVPDLDQTSLAVLEVSSFQLDYCESFQPKISVLLNITPDHLDRYGGSMELYTAAKCRIFKNQTMRDHLVYCFDDVVTRGQVERLASRHVHALPFALDRRSDEGSFVEDGKIVTILDGCRSEIVDIDLISIKGQHNLYNSMAAALVARILGIDAASMRATLRNFKGVEHRLEFVREVNNVRYINDSKATNVDSVWYAIQAFKEPIVLMLGGRDKGNDYSRLRDLAASHVKAIVAMGESAGKVVEAFRGATHVVSAKSMEEAVREARGLAVSGDVVLLSPACASFDWFENYEHRGRVFKELVNKL
jgi:UDP-N-acetylmuramoylalanine--D-glutamate ligase